MIFFSENSLFLVWKIDYTLRTAFEIIFWKFFKENHWKQFFLFHWMNMFMDLDEVLDLVEVQLKMNLQNSANTGAGSRLTR